MATSKKTAVPQGTPAKSTTAKNSVDKTLKRSSSKEYTIKYENKSGGQPELVPIFNSIKALMRPYAKGSLKEKGEKGGIYNLVSDKPVVIEGRKKDELYFASIIIQKGYVGFYFMPVYGADKPEQVFNPELLKALKGKACFHIKKNDAQTLSYIKDALKAGYNIYKLRGWI